MTSVRDDLKVFHYLESRSGPTDRVAIVGTISWEELWRAFSGWKSQTPIYLNFRVAVHPVEGFSTEDLPVFIKALELKRDERGNNITIGGFLRGTGRKGAVEVYYEFRPQKWMVHKRTGEQITGSIRLVRSDQKSTGKQSGGHIRLVKSLI